MANGCRQSGSNRQKRCPKSSATSIGLRSRTLATIAGRISHSHPALTVAGATRIQHHCGTRGDRDATVCSASPAHRARPTLHRPSQFSRPASFYLIFLDHWFRLIPASCTFAALEPKKQSTITVSHPVVSSGVTGVLNVRKFPFLGVTPSELKCRFRLNS